MTVRELISELQKQDPNAVVVASVPSLLEHQTIYRETRRIVSFTVGRRQSGGIYPHFARLVERNIVEAVCLE